MAIEKKEIDYAKEAGDVLFMLEELVKDIKAGKGAAELAAENLPNLMDAVNGVTQIKDELQANKSAVFATAGYHIGSIAGTLIS